MYNEKNAKPFKYVIILYEPSIYANYLWFTLKDL